jgi:type II secretory pathway component PulM
MLHLQTQTKGIKINEHCRERKERRKERTLKNAAGSNDNSPRQKVGLARTVYITVYVLFFWVISLPKIPYIHRIYMVLTNPIFDGSCCDSIPKALCELLMGKFPKSTL